MRSENLSVKSTEGTHENGETTVEERADPPLSGLKNSQMKQLRLVRSEEGGENGADGGGEEERRRWKAKGMGGEAGERDGGGEV